MTNLPIILPKSIVTDRLGFNSIAEIHKNLILRKANFQHEPPFVDMSRLQWIDANMCAPLGAVLVRGAKDFDDLRISLPKSKTVEDILLRNGFLSAISQLPKRKDMQGTTIEFKIFKSSTIGMREFSGHAHRIIADRDGLVISEGLKNHLVRNVLEIFNNSVIHSESSAGIFACGQFYPIKHRIRLTISDLGSGFLPKVIRHLGDSTITSSDAIKWAVKKGNTTKVGTPGGLGLGLLFEFIEINGGKMQIVSGNSLWQYEKGREACYNLTCPLLGTSVSISINTGVGAKYSFLNEVDFDLEDLF
ncbi:hypothetical protein DESA109040_21845 [Deinococcus saxicola]|uniref:hypothetical protein n=1 Tax=Deinococcus saxicola TaxID=249406 RepID=UPI0039F13699